MVLLVVPRVAVGISKLGELLALERVGVRPQTAGWLPSNCAGS